MHPRPRWQQAVQLVGVIHAEKSEAQQFQQETRFPGQLLVDPLGAARSEYHVDECPAAWLVEKGGAVHWYQPKHVTATELAHRAGRWVSGHYRPPL
jgi:hypothetical protein